jgi:hypothetical protein
MGGMAPQRDLVVLDVPGALRGQLLQVVRAVAPKVLHILVGPALLQGDQDRAIGQGLRQAPYPGGGRGGKGLEGADPVVVAFAAEMPSALGVAGVEGSAEFLIVAEESIDFIDQKSWAIVIHGPEHGGRGQVLGLDPPGHQAVEHVQQGALSAALLRRGDAQPGRVLPVVETVRVDDPERHGVGHMGRHDDMTAQDAYQPIEEIFAIDGLGPGGGIQQA